MTASKKFSSGCFCKRATSIGSGGSGGGGGDTLWELVDGVVSTILDRPVRVENVISSVVLEIDSDERLKTNIKPLTAASSSIESLFKNVEAKEFAYKKSSDDTHYGFIAQDIKNAGNGLEHLISTNDEGFYRIRMLEIIPFLFAKIKQLEERIVQLEK